MKCLSESVSESDTFELEKSCFRTRALWSRFMSLLMFLHICSHACKKELAKSVPSVLVLFLAYCFLFFWRQGLSYPRLPLRPLYT